MFCVLSSRRMGLFNVTIEKEQALAQRMARLGIRESDIIEQFIRGSGNGGQKVNKTSSCVYLKHVPTGIEVKCQRDRSQAHNRFLARRELCDRVEQRLSGVKAEEKSRVEKIRRQKRKRSRSGKEKMLASKAKRSETKRMRGRHPDRD